MAIKYLSVEEILLLHYKVIEDFGGSHGVRDENRLKSVEAMPKQEVFGKELYPTIYEKAAVYIRSIIGDHPFSDGNKRSGITVAAVFLMRNKVDLSATNKELEDFAVQVAVEKLDVPKIANWLQKHSSVI
jgi:death on curing protein